MNIFFLSRYPEKCARHHCDKHVVKMVTEYAQILSTSHHVLDGRAPALAYRKTHHNHPSTAWARSSDEHYEWLASLYRALALEYAHRYGREHGAATRGRVAALSRLPRRIASAGWSDPPQCMPESLRGRSAVLAYRRYYVQEKAHILRWRNRPVPDWAARIAADR